jgi:hypothetical protein
MKIRDALAIDLDGYLAKQKAVYWISGMGQISDIQPDILFKTYTEEICCIHRINI